YRTVAGRRAVEVWPPGLVRTAPADHGLAAKQAWPVGRPLRFVQRLLDRRRIVAVDVAHDVPAVGLEAFRRVVGEPVLDVAVDRNAVVVVEADQLAEAQRAGQRRRFVADALHQAAV